MKVLKLHNLKLVARDTFQHMQQAQLPLVASSLAYTTILSLIPLIAVSFAVFQLFGGLQSLKDIIEPFVINNLAEGVSDEVLARIEGFITNAHASAIGLGGLIGLAITSLSMLYSIEKAVNRVWHARMSRSFLRRVSAYGLFVTLGPLALAAALGAAASLHLSLGTLGPAGLGSLVLSAAGFFAIYRWLPNTPVSSRCAAVAASLIAVVFHGTQLGFRIYAAHFLSYDRIYGSLGALPVLLLWIYIAWIVVLSGAAFTAALQKRLEVLNQPRPLAGPRPEASGL